MEIVMARRVTRFGRAEVDGCVRTRNNWGGERGSECIGRRERCGILCAQRDHVVSLPRERE